MLSFEDLKGSLSPIDAPVNTIDGLKLGTILIPIFYKQNKILFIKRSENLKDHPGQIAFPGGRVDPSDDGIVSACFRETFEEVGLKKDQIKLLGRLSPLETSSGFYVYPFVGLVEPEAKIIINPNEVEKVFFVSIADLLNPSNYSYSEKEGKVYTLYNVEGYTIWGVTSKILTELIAKIREL
ncbi:MAG: NUDIX hydrolase [Candidatus Heimdallarchaeaceae archaeon]